MAHFKTVGLGFILLIFCAGCGSDGDSTPNENTLYEICGDEVTHGEMSDFIDGNCVIVGSFKEEGFASSELVTGMMLNIVLNGIDFSNLADYDVSFDADTGHYVLGDGKSHVGFTLYFEEDFGEASAGDPIPYNIFDVDTFVTNVDVSISFSLEVSVTYDEGPLYDLVDGDVSVDADSVSDFSVVISIDPKAVAIAIDSEQTYSGSWPWTKEDQLTLKMTSTKMSLFDFTDQLESGGLGMAYTGTEYYSKFFGVDQVFEDAEFLMLHDGDSWYWEGEYRSDVAKYGMTLYQSGFVSNVEQNYTEYYCEEGLDTLIGTARHNLDLEGGRFEFKDGKGFDYDLGSY